MDENQIERKKVIKEVRQFAKSNPDFIEFIKAIKRSGMTISEAIEFINTFKTAENYLKNMGDSSRISPKSK